MDRHTEDRGKWHRDMAKEFPQDMTLPLQRRFPDREHQELYAHLEREAEDIRSELFRDFSAAHNHSSEPLPEIISDKLLKQVAFRAREFAQHYDNYKVGGVLVGLREPTAADPNPWVIMFDANTKPTVYDDKHCAEQYLMDRAEQAMKEGKLKSVKAFLIVASPRGIPDDPVGFMDDVSKMKQMTLTPCALCRERMTNLAKKKSPVISLDATEVITANSRSRDLWSRKYQKVKDLPAFHGEPLPAGFETIEQGD